MSVFVCVSSINTRGQKREGVCPSIPRSRQHIQNYLDTEEFEASRVLTQELSGIGPWSTLMYGMRSFGKEGSVIWSSTAEGVLYYPAWRTKCLCVLDRQDGRPFWLISLHGFHTGHTPEMKKQKLQQLFLDVAHQLLPFPVIIGGDFNCGPALVREVLASEPLRGVPLQVSLPKAYFSRGEMKTPEETTTPEAKTTTPEETINLRAYAEDFRAEQFEFWVHSSDVLPSSDPSMNHCSGLEFRAEGDHMTIMDHPIIWCQFEIR